MKRRVLVAEDDPLIRQILETILDLEEFEVAVATDGAEALAIYGAERPDIVVLDVQMPGVDGLEVCRRIKADGGEGVPVIMLTARDTPEDVRAGKDAGADAYLTKPFSPLALIDTISRITA